MSYGPWDTKQAWVLSFNPPTTKNICKNELRRYENVNKQQARYVI
jgi:hypothetical protein